MSKRFVYHYDVYAQYNDRYLANTIRQDHVKQNVMWAAKRIQENGMTVDLPETELLQVEYDGKPYLLPSTYVDKTGDTKDTESSLPIQFSEHGLQKWAYSGKVYGYVPTINSVKLRREQKFGYREYIDTVYCPYEHSNPLDYLVAKLMMQSSHDRRCCFRIATPPAFGKNSLLDPFAKLRCDAVLFQPGSLPALYRRMNNRIMGLNEVCGVKKEVKEVLIRFLEDAGDGSAFFERDKIDMKFGKDRYDISKMSVVLFYNRVCDLETGSDKKLAFFDYVFPGKIRNRFFPVCFSGGLLERFTKPLDAVAEYEANKQDIIDFQRTIGYYQENIHQHMHGWKRRGYFEGSRMVRWAETFDSILHSFDAYANTQEEFTFLETVLINRHECYNRMMQDEPRMDDSNDKLEDEVDYGFKTPLIPDTMCGLKPLPKVEACTQAAPVIVPSTEVAQPPTGGEFDPLADL